MPVIDCPFPDCDYQTQDGTEALAVVLLQMHATAVHPPATSSTAATAVKTDNLSHSIHWWV